MFANILSEPLAYARPVGKIDGRGFDREALSGPEARARPRRTRSTGNSFYIPMSQEAQKIVVSRPGGYRRLELRSAPRPSPRPGEVLVETEAIGVNFADVVVRLGLYPSAREYVGWPITPGFEFSGRVLSVGEGVSEFREGEPVFGASFFGAYATHLAVPAPYLFKRPTDISATQAAVMVVAPLTAYYALAVLGAAAPGKKILVHSAAGGVGSMMVQIGKALGCVVVGTVGSPEKAQAVQALGADRVVVRSEPGFSARLLPPGERGFDIVADANGYETLKESYRVLRPTGRLVIYGAHSMMSRGSALPNPLRLLWGLLRTPSFRPLEMTNANKSVMAFNLSYLFAEVDTLRAAMTQILDLTARGLLRPQTPFIYPFREVAEAHKALQSGKTIGKLVLVP